jgi:hypothetical protein
MSARSLAATLLAGLLMTARATAASPYCTKVRERAADEASLLIAPRVYVQGLRFPDNGLLEGGTVTGSGFQARAGVSFSATDLYKGLGAMGVAEADCREHETRLELEATLVLGDDGPKRSAYEAQIAFLEAHRDEVHRWIERAEARFAEHVITLVELEDMRAQATALDRKLVQARGQATLLAARSAAASGAGAGAKSTEQLSRAYSDASADLVRAANRVRSGDAWQLEMTAGIIPFPREEWFGLVQLGFNLGGFLRRGHAERFAAARNEEIEHASYEAGAGVHRYLGALAAAHDQARRELELVERERERLARTLRALAGSEAPNVIHERERLALDELALEAEAVYARVYAEELRALLARG